MTPDPSNNATSLARAVEKKDTQATVVAILGDIPESTMAETASSVWGKPGAQNIMQVVFVNKGKIVAFVRS